MFAVVPREGKAQESRRRRNPSAPGMIRTMTRSVPLRHSASRHWRDYPMEAPRTLRRRAREARRWWHVWACTRPGAAICPSCSVLAPSRFGRAASECRQCRRCAQHAPCERFTMLTCRTAVVLLGIGTVWLLTCQPARAIRWLWVVSRHTSWSYRADSTLSDAPVPFSRAQIIFTIFFF